MKWPRLRALMPVQPKLPLKIVNSKFLLMVSILPGFMQAGFAQKTWPVFPQDASEHLIQKINPVYPPTEKAAKTEGFVILKVYVNKDGTIMRALDTGGRPQPLFTQAALDAVKQWVYRPFLVNGEAVEAVTTVTFRF